MSAGGGQVLATPTVVLDGDSTPFKGMIAGAQQDLQRAGATMSATADRVSASIGGRLGKGIEIQSQSMAAFGQEATFAGERVAGMVQPVNSASQSIAGLDALARHTGRELGVGMARSALLAGESLNKVVDSMKKAAASGNVMTAALAAGKTAMSKLATAGGLLVVGLIAIDLWNEHLKKKTDALADASDRAGAMADRMREAIHSGIIVNQDNARSLELVTGELAAFRRGGTAAVGRVDDLAQAFRTAKEQWLASNPSQVAITDETLRQDEAFKALLATQRDVIRGRHELTNAEALAATKSAEREAMIDRLTDAGAREMLAEQGVAKSVADYAEKTEAALHPVDAFTQALRDENAEFTQLAMTASVYGIQLDKINALHAARVTQLIAARAGADTAAAQDPLEALDRAAGKLLTAEEIAHAWRVEIRGVSKDVDEMIEKLGEWGGVAQSIALGGIDAFVDFANGASGAMRQFANEAIRQIERILVKMLLIKAIETFFPGSGSFLQAIGLTARAGGGPVMADHPYLVGENGPELFMPSSAGNIIANGGGSAMVSTPSLPPYPRVMSPEALAVDDYWRRFVSAAIPDHAARGGRR